MKIELKNVKFSEFMSEETNAFTCDVFINGIKSAYAKNDGHGGCTFYHFYEGKRELVEQAEKFCLGLPCIKYGGYELEMNLEMKIDLLFEDWLKEKESAKFKKKLEKDCLKGICVKTDNGYSLIQWKGHTLESILKHPQGKFTIKNKLLELKKENKEVLNKNISIEML